MSLLFKEGILYKNERVWKETTVPYYMCFAYGDWEPNTVSKKLVYSTESSNTRLLLQEDDIEVGWNLQSNLDEVIISKTFTVTEDIKFNRIFIKKGGQERAKYKVNWGTFNTITFLEPSLVSFQSGDIIAYNNGLYEIDTIDTGLSTASLIPLNNAPYTPSSGIGIVSDASGILLVANVLDKPYIFLKDTEVFVRLYGYTL